MSERSRGILKLLDDPVLLCGHHQPPHPRRVTNLLDILAAGGGSADGITTYGALKSAVTAAVVTVLEPLQKSYAELAADPAYVESVFAAGCAQCREVTASVLADATAAMGL